MEEEEGEVRGKDSEAKGEAEKEQIRGKKGKKGSDGMRKKKER